MTINTYVVVSAHNRPHTLFEYFKARFVAQNNHQKIVCHYGIGLCPPNLDTLLGSIINKNGGIYMMVSRERESLL